MHIDQWNYKTPDNILTITIYEKSAIHVALSTVDFNTNFMNSK